MMGGRHGSMGVGLRRKHSKALMEITGCMGTSSAKRVKQEHGCCVEETRRSCSARVQRRDWKEDRPSYTKPLSCEYGIFRVCLFLILSKGRQPDGVPFDQNTPRYSGKWTRRV